MRAFLLTLALLVTVPLSAQDWRGMLEKVDNDLRTQNYAHARKMSIKLINSMCDRLGTGPDSMYTLAVTVAYRALAENGLGNSDEAHWYWHVALALYPKLAQRDWSAYGEIGKDPDALQTIDSAVPPPTPIKTTMPKCPLSAVNGSYFQAVKVAAVVDGDGIPRCPRLVSPTMAPTLVYTVFESLKDWQFQAPAVEGKAVPAKYELTVDFQPPHP
jgi:hypothetical protein